MYSRKHILKAVFFIILASMTVSGYFLKPIDVKIAHYYESLSMYKEAITSYEKSLKATGDQYFQREILVRISILCRYIGDYDKFLVTVKRLLDLEYESPELMKDGMATALNLWHFNEADKRKQDYVIYFAKKGDNRNFLIDWETRGFLKRLLCMSRHIIQEILQKKRWKRPSPYQGGQVTFSKGRNGLSEP